MIYIGESILHAMGNWSSMANGVLVNLEEYYSLSDSGPFKNVPGFAGAIAGNGCVRGVSGK